MRGPGGSRPLAHAGRLASAPRRRRRRRHLGEEERRQAPRRARREAPAAHAGRGARIRPQVRPPVLGARCRPESRPRRASGEGWGEGEEVELSVIGGGCGERGDWALFWDWDWDWDWYREGGLSGLVWAGLGCMRYHCTTALHFLGSWVSLSLPFPFLPLATWPSAAAAGGITRISFVCAHIYPRFGTPIITTF
ncbi:hypothetical protein K505DRAFT_127876 [Melanomma pulvis-pyrius CBS 109.77]|uniref:Uncharacterized protein n=1 Tax=Melanomma pulvis-pyrius CBS 109.77 TaxID=1314802 RepID=A0A6A6WU48_9PLEO|nr:hypothetical protein K505DRAFT_127876 [Melanomma pulvis-pyrius CBS 109.77]